MEAFLRGLLLDLERRCKLLESRLSGIETDPDVRDHALRAYKTLEIDRREAAQLLSDPDLGLPQLIHNHLRLYRRWAEEVELVEALIPFIERYNNADRRLTRLSHALADQIRWPLTAPIVATFSSQYYWTITGFNIICVPTGEGFSLLSWPDLCHEFGHLLLWQYEAEILDNFITELISYIYTEKQRVDRNQRPPQYKQLYDDLLEQWEDTWMREFISDMVATYIIGPAFGWQHIRLAASSGQPAFYPSLGQTLDHPADEARFRGIITVLNHMGATAAVSQLAGLWDSYLWATRATKPSDYDLCYPETLIERLARNTVAACKKLGIRDFSQVKGDAHEIPRLLVIAWQQFFAAPESYGEWEVAELERLWTALGLATS